MVEYDQPPSFGEYVAMHEELETIFGTKVDLVTCQAVEAMSSATRQKSILSSAKLVSGEQENRPR
jgi:predicted nucleotidyltransferase